MRKVFALIAISMMSLAAMATDYTDTLTVDINGKTAYKKSTISLTKQNENVYTLSLKNFIYSYNGGQISLGTITFADCKAKETDRGLLFEENVKTTIEAGDIEGIKWKGSQYGELTFAMRASLIGNKLQAEIDFTLPDSPEKVFKLHFGDGKAVVVAMELIHFPNVVPVGVPDKIPGLVDHARFTEFEKLSRFLDGDFLLPLEAGDA